MEASVAISIYMAEKQRAALRGVPVLCSRSELSRKEEGVEKKKYPKGEKHEWNTRRTDLCMIGACDCNHGVRVPLSPMEDGSSDDSADESLDLARSFDDPITTGEFLIIPPSSLDDSPLYPNPRHTLVQSEQN